MFRFPCPKCGFVLSAPEEFSGRDAKCRQCGVPVKIPPAPAQAAKSPSPNADVQPTIAKKSTDARPKNVATQSPSESPTPIANDRPIAPYRPVISFLAYAVPTFAIFVALLSMVLPLVIDQHILALAIACLAVLASLVGFVFLLLNRWKGIPIHLAGMAICISAVLVSINITLIKVSIASNEELLAKNERAVAQAKADHDESKKKLAEVEDVPRKAEEILKKAEEAPKKAEAIFKLAKELQDKADATEKKNAEMAAKIEEMENKNDLARKKLVEDLAKIELAEKELRANQKSVMKSQKEIDDKRQELLAIKKEIESDKKTAADELAAMKKEIDAENVKVEEKRKEARDLLKKIEGALKGASLKLQDKNPLVRLNTAKQLAKLPVFAEAKEHVGEALCMALLDTNADIRNAAAEALEKIDPAVHLHAVTLVIGKDKWSAAGKLAGLGKNAKSALPILLYYQKAEKAGKSKDAFTSANLLGLVLKIAPDDPRVAQVILNEIAKNNYQAGVSGKGKTIRFVGNNSAAHVALESLDKIDANSKDKLRALLTALNTETEIVMLKNGIIVNPLSVGLIGAIEKLGSDASDAIPLLTKLKASPEDQVRAAAVKALAKIQSK